MTLSEPQVVDQLESWLKQGRVARDNATPCPHPANTIAYYQHMTGWHIRDLQLALCVAKPSYGREQLACGNITAAQMGAS